MLCPGTDGRPGFASTTEQRLHFKTDWHRLNVKRRTAGHAPLSEDQFEAMLEGHHEVNDPVIRVIDVRAFPTMLIIQYRRHQAVWQPVSDATKSWSGSPLALRASHKPVQGKC